MTTDAFPDRKYDGFIKEISPEANRQKATVQVKVKISKPDEYLRPEMNASVAFAVRGEAGEPRRDDRREAGGDRALVGACTMARSSCCWTARRVRRTVKTGATSRQGVRVEQGLDRRRGSDRQSAGRFERRRQSAPEGGNLMSEAIIETRNLTKEYRARRVPRDRAEGRQPGDPARANSWR